MANNSRKKRGERHPIVRTTRCIAWLVLAACIAGFGWILAQEHSAKELGASLRQKYHAAMSASAETLEMPVAMDMPIAVDTPRTYEVQENFAELYAENNDLVGWLTVCENIEEPVVYRDNSYYMDHDFNGNSSIAGSIFLDEENDKAMTDSMVLLYGHNMRSGTMFGDLDALRDTDYLKQHPILTLHSVYEAEPREYVIVSTFDASMLENDPSYIHIRQFNFESPEAFQAQIDDIMSRSYLQTGVPVDTTDHYVMLVTCSYTHDDGRFLVVARRLRNGETADQITSQYFQ